MATLTQMQIQMWKDFVNAFRNHVGMRMKINASPQVTEIMRYALRNRQYGEALEIIALLKEEQLRTIFEELLLATVDDLGYVQRIREHLLRIDQGWLHDHLEAGVQQILVNPQVDLFYAYPLLFEIAIRVNQRVAVYIVDQAKGSQDPDLVEIGEDLKARLDQTQSID